MKGLLAALQFLSVLPIPRRFTTDDIGRSLVFFPAAGLVIGAFAALGYGFALALRLPALVSALVGVLFLSALTGFLHLDGVADTADGFFSARPRERILAIMRDSRIGTMGVIGVFAVLSLKWAALAGLPPAIGWRALVLAPMLGRAGQVMTLNYVPYARAEGGLASVFLDHCSRKSVFAALASFFFAAVFLGGPAGLLAPCAAAGFGVYFNFRCIQKIGGMTGDTLGAVSEGIETAAMCALCVGAA